MDNGTFYLSTVFHGIISFHPRDIKLNIIPPNILLTDIKIDGISFPVSEDSPLKQDISLTKEHHLEHHENDRTIEMTTLHFAYPENTQYKYWLENYDDGWQESGINRSAVYTNLNPDNYIFHAKGSNGDGIWSEEEATLVIIIQPPWWRTWIAYIVYVLLIFALIYDIMKWIKNRGREKARIRETKLHALAAEAHARATEAEKQAFKAENERKTKKLEEAQQLQLSMLPKDMPQLLHLDIAVYMQTATEVGGDYYDFNLSENGAFTVAVGDAIEHGIRAVNMVVSIKSLFKDLPDDTSIPDFFNKCTKVIKNMNMDKLFMSLTVIRIKDNQVTLSSSGMPPAYIFSKSEDTVMELLIKGMPLGVVHNFPEEERSFTMAKDDTLLFFTDGLPELFNEQLEMFEHEHFKPILMDAA